MAAEYKFHGKGVVATLSDNVALPNATSGYTTNDYNMIGATNNGLQIVVYANTAISIATGQAINIELVAGASADPTTSPIDNAHVYLLHKTSADNKLDFAAGDLVCSYVLDDLLLADIPYVRLKITTDADESSELYSAFVIGH